RQGVHDVFNLTIGNPTTPDSLIARDNGRASVLARWSVHGNTVGRDYFHPDPRQRWRVDQHIGIACVGQRAITLLRGNASPHLLAALPEPDLLEVIIMVAQIAEIIRPDATRPNRAVGVDLRAGPPGIAIDHLIFFFQDALDQFVILDPKG